MQHAAEGERTHILVLIGKHHGTLLQRPSGSKRTLIAVAVGVVQHLEKIQQARVVKTVCAQ